MPTVDVGLTVTNVLNRQRSEKRSDLIEEVLVMVPLVTLYEFNTELKQWSPKDIQGTFFVVKRNTQPQLQFIVKNILSSEEFVEYLGEDFQYEVKIPSLLYQNAEQKINGIQFTVTEDCEQVAQLFRQILGAQSKVYPSEMREMPTGAVIEAPLVPKVTAPMAAFQSVISCTAILAVLTDNRAALAVDSAEVLARTNEISGYCDKTIEVLDTIFAAGAGDGEYITVATKVLCNQVAREHFDKNCDSMDEVAFCVADVIDAALASYHPKTMAANRRPCFLLVGFKGNTRGIYAIDWDVPNACYERYFLNVNVATMGSAEEVMDEWRSTARPVPGDKELAEWCRDCIGHAVDNVKNIGGTIAARIISRQGNTPFTYSEQRGADGKISYLQD